MVTLFSTQIKILFCVAWGHLWFLCLCGIFVSSGVWYSYRNSHVVWWDFRTVALCHLDILAEPLRPLTPAARPWTNSSCSFFIFPNSKLMNLSWKSCRSWHLPHSVQHGCGWGAVIPHNCWLSQTISVGVLHQRNTSEPCIQLQQWEERVRLTERNTAYVPSTVTPSWCQIPHRGKY